MIKAMKNKKIDIEALENVAGGNALETSADSRFLNVVLQGRPEKCDRYGEPKMRLGDHDQEIVKAWASVGITAKIHLQCTAGSPCL